MAVRPEQSEYLKFRKAINDALLEEKVIGVDYEYNLGTDFVIVDTRDLMKKLSVAKSSLKRLKEMMK